MLEEPKIPTILDGSRYDYVLQLSGADPRNWSSYGAAGDYNGFIAGVILMQHLLTDLIGAPKT